MLAKHGRCVNTISGINNNTAILLLHPLIP